MSVLDYRSSAEDLHEKPSITRWLGWAVYLGMSWTWCIGMFLPVLLVRDFGLLGWVVFAIPNVLGAAAMGWVLKDKTSELIAAAHYPVITSFSFVTATFQIYFAASLITIPDDPPWFWLTVAGAILTLMLCRSGQWRRLFLAVIVLVCSIGLIIRSSSSVYVPHLEIPKAFPEMLALSSLFLVCAFGFMLCPYLDATFHMSRQKMKQPDARIGFAVGFGIFFLAMIVFSLCYASHIGYVQQFHWVYPPGRALAAFWILQLAFTIGIHWNSDDAIGNTKSPRSYWMAAGSLIVGGAIGLSVHQLGEYANLFPGELIYRLFMAFYGLVFPAYVWLCMIPGRGRVAPDRRQWIVLAVSVILASPMYWMGFIERKMVWVLPGLALVLLARLFVKSNTLPMLEKSGG